MYLFYFKRFLKRFIWWLLPSADKGCKCFCLNCPYFDDCYYSQIDKIRLKYGS